MKYEKGFIHIPILIVIISIITASAGAGVVLHKQGKLIPLVADISEVFKGIKKVETSDIISVIEIEEQKELKIQEELKQKELHEKFEEEMIEEEKIKEDVIKEKEENISFHPQKDIEITLTPSTPSAMFIDTTDLEIKIENLEGRILSLTNVQDDLIDRYNDLLDYTKDEISNLTTNHNSLVGKFNNLLDDHDSLIKKHNNLVNRVSKISIPRDVSDNSALEYQIIDLESKIEKLENTTEKICKNAFSTGGFSIFPYCSFREISTELSLKKEIQNLKKSIENLEYKIQLEY